MLKKWFWFQCFKICSQNSISYLNHFLYDKDLQASLIVSKEAWTNQIHQTLLNGKKNPRLNNETAEELKYLMFEKLSEESNHLLSHWKGSELVHSKQLPILIQVIFLICWMIFIDHGDWFPMVWHKIIADLYRKVYNWNFKSKKMSG